MTTTILSHTDRSIRATCGKKTAHIFLASTGHVWVTCENVMHKVYCGGGKTFLSFEEAVHGYKSAEMKAIIQLAAQIIAA